MLVITEQTSGTKDEIFICQVGEPAAGRGWERVPVPCPSQGGAGGAGAGSCAGAPRARGGATPRTEPVLLLLLSPALLDLFCSSRASSCQHSAFSTAREGLQPHGVTA